MSEIEPSFRVSVDLMFNRAIKLLQLSPGFEQKIRVCSLAYKVRLGVRLRGKIETFRGVLLGAYGACEGGLRYALAVH